MRSQALESGLELYEESSASAFRIAAAILPFAIVVIMNHQHRRKKVYVSRAIQGRLLARLTAYFVLYHVFLWHILFLTQELMSGRPGSFAERYARFYAEHAILLVCMICVLPILVWDMLKFSHRIAGPFVRFERALKQMANGESIEPISLRKGDLLMEFLDVFNEFIAASNRERNSAANRRDTRGGQPAPTDRGAAGGSEKHPHEETPEPLESHV